MSHGDLSKTRLHECLETGHADAHLAACDGCQRRLAELGGFTGVVRATEDAAFARAFPEARIAASRQRVLAAIDEQRAARVVPFPGAVQPSAPSLRARPRWMAAATAGLIIGLALGRWTQSSTPVQPAPGGSPAISASVQPAAFVRGEDDLLDAIESVRLGPIAGLRSLHELTPLAEQYDPAWRAVP